MPVSFTRLLLLLALLLVAGPGHAQAIDTEAASAYWKMTDALRRNEPLTNRAWQNFLDIPANQMYVSAVFGSDTASLSAYRRAIEVVYMPRYDSLRQARLKANKWYYVLVNRYKEREPLFRKFLTETVQKPAFLEKMYTYSYAYLPTRAHVRPDTLRLHYVAIGNDATSQGGRDIVFSLYSAYESQLIRPGILEAHELHHALMNYALTPAENLTRPAQPEDEGLLWLLRASLIEGLADLTDKQVQLAAPTDSAEMRRHYFTPAPRVLHKVDSTIQAQAAGGTATPERFYRRLTNGSNGHLPGFFMAYTILQNGYRKPLLDHVDDPIAFALLYQKAAKKDKQHQHPPVFAEASVRYLRQLGRKYIQPRQAPAAAPKP